MYSRWNPLRVVVSLVTVVSMLLGMVPWTVKPVEAAVSEPATLSELAVYLPVRWRAFVAADAHSETDMSFSATLTETMQLSLTVFLPLVARSYIPPVSDGLLIYPGIGGTIGTPDRRVQVTFTPVAVTETARVHCGRSSDPYLGDRCSAVLRYGKYISRLSSSIAEDFRLPQDFLE